MAQGREQAFLNTADGLRPSCDKTHSKPGRRMGIKDVDGC